MRLPSMMVMSRRGRDRHDYRYDQHGTSGSAIGPWKVMINESPGIEACQQRRDYTEPECELCERHAFYAGGEGRFDYGILSRKSLQKPNFGVSGIPRPIMAMVPISIAA